MLLGAHLRCEWASRPIPGEAVSGDLAFAKEVPGGALVAVVDALGHGPKARLTSEAAERLLGAHADLPLEDLLAHCHLGLRKTRGVALCAARVDARSRVVSWAGVGNVTALVFHAHPGERSPPRQSLRTYAGVVGYRIPKVRAAHVQAERGDLLVMATDGVEEGFEAQVSPSRDPGELACELLFRFGKPTDDALVLVAQIVS